MCLRGGGGVRINSPLSSSTSSAPASRSANSAKLISVVVPMSSIIPPAGKGSATLPRGPISSQQPKLAGVIIHEFEFSETHQRLRRPRPTHPVAPLTGRYGWHGPPESSTPPHPPPPISPAPG